MAVPTKIGTVRDRICGQDRGRLAGVGGEADSAAPIAVAVAAAAVGPHFHRVVGSERETRQRVGIRGHRDGVGLVIIDTDLPFGGLAILGPADDGNGILALNRHIRGRGTGLWRGEDHGSRPIAISRLATAVGTHTHIVGGLRREAAQQDRIVRHIILVCEAVGESWVGVNLIIPRGGIAVLRPSQLSKMGFDIGDGQIRRRGTCRRIGSLEQAQELRDSIADLAEVIKIGGRGIHTIQADVANPTALRPEQFVGL